MIDALECGVCLTLPEGVVHQCHEGHCYCADCWDRLEEPRRCPECRLPLPQANRCRAAERAIAALEASCEHCGEATTRGAMATHLLVCPHRPASCTAAAAGCVWAGVASEQAEHEAACPIASFLRMMAPLQAECQELESECHELRARAAALVHLVVDQQAQMQSQQAQMEQIQTRNEQLQRQVAALQPLAGRLRMQLRSWRAQRAARPPHGPPPSDAAVAEMGLAEAVAALQARVAVARVVERAFERLSVLCAPVGSEHAAAEAGAMEAAVAAMWTHLQVWCTHTMHMRSSSDHPSYNLHTTFTYNLYIQPSTLRPPTPPPIGPQPTPYLNPQTHRALSLTQPSALTSSAAVYSLGAGLV